MADPIRVSMTIFPDDDPLLYAWASSLPDSRHRRRATFLQALRAGLTGGHPGNNQNQPRQEQPATENKETLIKNISTIHTPHEEALPEMIGMEDLSEIFGEPTLNNA